MTEDVDELMRKRQQVKIICHGRFGPVIGIINSYIPKNSVWHYTENRDQLLVEISNNRGFTVLPVSAIAQIEVLPREVRLI